MPAPVALLDLDGTLIDPRPGITQSVQAGLAAVGIEPRPADAYVGWIGPPLRQSFLELGGVAPGDLDRAVAGYRARFDRVGWREHDLYPGVVGVLAELRRAGWRLAVVTSKPEVYARRIVAHRDLDDAFDDVVGSELDGRRSAKAELVAHALERLGGVEPADAAMVGDREHDVIGAVACGVAAVGVAWGYGDPALLLAEGAVVVVEQPADLPTVLQRTVLGTAT
ncbi:MAG: HAD hydrolase-like protein [Acidimicrobiales bacterium]